jgi:RND superfamily putative drug exporter
MVLMGDINWYMPRWLDRLVPHISIEGAEFFEQHDEPATVKTEPQPAA